ncbi:helix-turn-helix domain-containing protein [Streptomyces sp. HUAS 31]|uniref:sigma-54-dependent Fis family transcriptional regulator n=1 Tax=Streptomyces TaxID=1883 RepID=UPI00230582E8|nr:helix-turn-helix domain-containing protein [Streptomyces sp. HUAS 31]WCE01205.1 helix-turn-helix domain-containing protein [Streptomyces sp. HUAS 31]
MTTAEQSPALAPLRQARERFLTGRPLPDGVPDDVVAAWRRARFFGVRPDLDGPVRESAQPADSPLLEAARPALTRIAPALDAGRTALVLTDERLRVLWSTGSAPGDDTCADLSEREVGHNSAALALRTRRRAEVHGPEHFLDVWQDVSAVSVPLFSPETGQVLGTLTVARALWAGCRPHPGAALAEAAAAAVEAELRARARTAERALLDAYERAARGRERAVVALDGRNRLISEAAAGLASPQVLEALERGARTRGRDTGESYGVPLPDAAGESHGVPLPTDAGESYDVPLPEDAGCTAEITPVRHEGRVLGLVAVLAARPVEPEPSTPVPGGALVGGSVAWRHAVARATELFRTPGPVLVTGERGTGKTALALELLDGTDPLVVDAAESPELGLKDGEWEVPSAGHRGKAGARPLLLRHAERLSQPDVAALNSLLEERPDARLIATHTPGTSPGPCLQRLLDTLAARSVTLPALRERPEDIRELLPVLTPGPAPGSPPLTWTLDALRALEQHPWPGNVTELAHLVRALAGRRRVFGPVRRGELPDPVREGPAGRTLSPMELAERSAILEALRRHGGNKARAATALGIGRATLYRKLREYQGRDAPDGPRP